MSNNIIFYQNLLLLLVRPMLWISKKKIKLPRKVLYLGMCNFKRVMVLDWIRLISSLEINMFANSNIMYW